MQTQFPPGTVLYDAEGRPVAVGPAAVPFRPATTNGLAITSFVLSLLWMFGLGSLAAIVLGAVANRQIRASEGTEGGAGLATAGMVIGVVGGVIAALFVLIVAVGALGASVDTKFDQVDTQLN